MRPEDGIETIRKSSRRDSRMNGTERETGTVEGRSDGHLDAWSYRWTLAVGQAFNTTMPLYHKVKLPRSWRT